MLKKKLEFSIFKGPLWAGYNSDYLDTWRTVKHSSKHQAEETFEMQLNSDSPYYRLYALVGLKILKHKDFEILCRSIAKSQDVVLVKIVSGKAVEMPLKQAVDLIVSSELAAP
ncbi:hypothetical protein [Psychromonas sp. SP041]|uniref:hypothetical protein n=1 Tax=Psychromonas sp. SP041 TaxID=1365007 RepID=UPI0010C79862|nr:hypothetical protein [Psychromonas sp. SP041]